MHSDPAAVRREVLEWVVGAALSDADADGAVVVVHGAGGGGPHEVLGLPVHVECDSELDDLVELRRWECGAYAPVVEASRYVLWDAHGEVVQELYHRLRCCGVAPQRSVAVVRAVLV